MRHFISVILGIIIIAARALALSILWGWFVVPFLGLPELSWAFALGLMLVVSVFQSMTFADAALIIEGNTGDISVVQIMKDCAGLVHIGFILALGFVVHSFIG